MSAGEHASPHGHPSSDLRISNAQHGTAHAANQLNATQTAAGRWSAAAYPYHTPEGPGTRRRDRRRHFLAGIVCAITGLGLCVKVLRWLSPHDIP